MSKQPPSSAQQGYFIGPKTGVLRPYFEANLDWQTTLGELIDNSFDAEASSVSISFSRQGDFGVCVVRDDGVGCENNEVMLSLATLGDHQGRKSTKLGRYGIGSKEAMLWIGGPGSVVLIESTHNKTKRSMRIDWDRIVSSDTWWLSQDDLHVGPADPEDRGTMIRIMGPKLRQIPSGKNLDQLVSNLGYIYAPALSLKRDRPRQIVFHSRKGAEPIVVPGYELPQLEPGHLDKKIVVGGKEARVYVGIVPPGVPNPRYGFTYTHEYRVVQENSDRGCGSFGSARIAGIVSLGSGWVLNKNKDGISRQAEELFDAVFECSRDILAAAEAKAQQLSSAVFDNLAESFLNECISALPPDRKARRHAGDKEGTRQPTGLGGKHKRAEKTKDGETFSSGCGGLRIQYAEGDPDKPGTFNGDRTIVLHTSHPAVAACRADRDIRGIAFIALPLVAIGSLLGEQKKLWERSDIGGSGTRDKFERALGLCLRGIRVDDQPVAEAVPANNQTETQATGR